jgi:hypothetical protein
MLLQICEEEGENSTFEFETAVTPPLPRWYRGHKQQLRGAVLLGKEHVEGH